MENQRAVCRLGVVFLAVPLVRGRSWIHSISSEVFLPLFSERVCEELVLIPSVIFDIIHSEATGSEIFTCYKSIQISISS